MSMLMMGFFTCSFCVLVLVGVQYEFVDKGGILTW